MTSRLTSTHFVGRVGELAELMLAVREASFGRPGLVLLGGDSGVGKTRLVAELEQRLAGDGEPPALILRGEGVEQSDGELPYAPLLSALRPLVREHNPVLDALSSGSRSQLATILPGLDDGRPRDDRPDPAGQVRLFEAVLELLDLLSEAGPVVLILEDMHWADSSTRNFVGFLSRSMRQERVVLLLTYRSDELHRRHALRPLLAELDRLERARRIDLEPFDRDELTEALTDILGAEPKAQLVDRLFSRSEGNPLYTEELLAAGLDGRAATPQSLRDAFLGRIERLSPETQRATRAVAVGRALDESTLVAVLCADSDEIQAALREALAEQVLIADDDDRFCFRHALLREALYDDLLPGERGEWHLALAKALEAGELGGEERELDRATMIASHYAAAGDQPAALRASVHAATLAGRAHAYAEVSELLERALELWPRVSEDARPPEIDHVDLLARAARAYGISGDRSRAEVLLARALEALDPERDTKRYAELLGRLSRVYWSLNRGPDAIATAERALSMLPAEQGGRERALLLAWLARLRILRGRYRDAIGDAEVALAAAIEAGDSLAECEVLNTLGMAQMALGRVEEGVGSLRSAIELARDSDDVDSLATAYSNLSDHLLLLGRTREALATAQEGQALTPRRFMRSHDWITLTVSESAFKLGDWVLSRASLTPSASRASGILLMFRQLREAELVLGVGDEEAADECLESIHDLVCDSSEPQWIALHGLLLGELCRRRHDYEAARAAVENALGRIELCTDDVMRIARVAAAGTRIEADRVQRARDLGEKGELREALTRCRLHVARLEAAAQEGGPVERAYLAEGKAELARARGRGAREWPKAVTAWEQVGRPYPVAIARWREAEANVTAGDRAAAAPLARAALETANELGSEWLAAEVTALAERGRLDLGVEESSNGAAASHDEVPFGLTPRERQVLALVAQGATNRQIGAALFMAEKTASVHVSRILAKLGVQGRTQAAAIAHRQHLD
jgi:DNA-binding CsgD family transcriptional regulator/tetratricopeptide (TPR) repeat protein